jgi:hypothetical protein
MYYPGAVFKKVLKFHPKQPINFLGLRAPEKKIKRHRQFWEALAG